MHIIINNAAILAKHVISRTSLLKISAYPNQITVISKGNDCQICEDIEGSVVEEGSISVNAFLLFNYVKNLKKNISIKSDNNVLYVEDKLKIPLHTLDELRIIEQEYNYFNIDTIMLMNILTKVRKLVSESINGILFNGDGRKLEIVATDLYRIIKTEIDIKIKCYFIIPSISINEIIKLCKVTERFEIGYANNLLIKFDKTKFYSNLLNIKFPQYNTLYTEYPNMVIINGAIISNIISRIKLVANDKLIINIKPNTMTLSGKSNIGHAEESIDIQYNGNNIHSIVSLDHFIHAISNSDIEIYFNLQYIMIKSVENNILYSTILTPIVYN